MTVELSTKFDLTSAEQLTFADDQSDDADLSDHLINMSKWLLKKILIYSVSADLWSEHIIQKKWTRIQSD